jgi:hypothetical protein
VLRADRDVALPSRRKLGCRNERNRENEANRRDKRHRDAAIVAVYIS